MLTKLLKYDFKATGRIILPIAGGVLLLNFVSGPAGAFCQQHRPYDALGRRFYGAAHPICRFGHLAVLAICLFASVQRYYKLLEQGYLMLALHAAWQPVAAKLICDVINGRCSAFYFGICGTLTLSALDGDSFSTVWRKHQDVPLLLLFFLLILALIAGAQLHAYLACAYAGMFTQHRLTISIISYFVIGFIGQMLSLVGTIVFAIKVYPSLDNIGSMVELQNGIFLSVCVIFLLTLLVDALLWALTQWLMSSRLNLA